MSDKNPIINLSMAAILKDIQAISKDRKNEQQGFKFRGIDDIYNELHGVFAAHGVTCLPFVQRFESGIAGTNAKGNNIYRTTVIMGYKFTATDGSQVEASVPGEGMDYADKATAKALSAAHKYLLIETFLIPTSDITDSDAYDPTVDPHEEIRSRRESDAKSAVDSAASGTDVQLSEEDKAKLEEKRKAAAAKPVKGKEVKKKEDKEPEPTPLEEKKPEEKSNGTPSGYGAAHLDHVMGCVSKEGILGVSVGAFTVEQLAYLKDKWAIPFKEKIDKDPKKSFERDCVIKALNDKLKEAAKP